ncbi:MAG: SDR family oxidoreductase [Desulfurivibrio sp.]|nr:SDR family oxidoreductase [Desulfurivibrio sp.]MBU4117850.1 SDR family oxidoreductase [Pseudomonadota bacterium]
MVILITGANGFVGLSLCAALAHSGKTVIAAMRHTSPDSVPNITNVQISTLAADTDWQHSLQGCDAVVHLAARVHVMTDTAADPLTEFRRVNVDGTLNLARQAIAVGVRRFIFISSIKVNGETTCLGQAFAVNDVPGPQDPYSISKYEAEQGLRKLAEETGLEVVIIRSPLVYGRGVRANFLSMMRWLKWGVPLPFGAIHNKRSLVALDNLVDLIITCIDHPIAANQTFLVSDGEDLSTTELLRRMANALGRPARLIPVPVFLLEVGAALLGRRDMAQRLCGSLQIDISKARTLLGWKPPVSVDESLAKTARHFLQL